MKQFLIFVFGFVAGIIAAIFFYILFSTTSQTNEELIGLNLFAEKGECIKIPRQMKILQVMKPNMALAETGNYSNQIMVLLINYDNKPYYDDLKIDIPNNKCARQIGTYQYTTKMGLDKTVPAVVIE